MSAHKAAIVTGAGSGIGQAIALRLCRDGYAVLAVDRQQAGLDATLALGSSSGHILPLAQDVTEDGAPAAIMAACLSQAGEPVVLVNNAGLGNARSARDTTDADLDRYIDVNFRSVFRLSRAFVRHEQAGARSIVNIASVFGQLGFPGTAPYSAAKAAVIGLTRQMCADCSPAGIRINAIAPGLIETPATADRLSNVPRFRRLTLDQIPSGRAGSADDIAGVTSFLCSPDAAYVNGAVLVVDGGWTATRYTAES